MDLETRFSFQAKKTQPITCVRTERWADISLTLRTGLFCYKKHLPFLTELHVILQVDLRGTTCVSQPHRRRVGVPGLLTVVEMGFLVLLTVGR